VPLSVRCRGRDGGRKEASEVSHLACQVRRAVPSIRKDEQLLPEQETLRDHCSHATTATQLRGKDG